MYFHSLASETNGQVKNSADVKVRIFFKCSVLLELKFCELFS